MSMAFDADLWLARIRTAEGRRVLCPPALAQAAAEHCYGRVLTVHAYMPEWHFSACLLAPDGERVTGGQARGPWAIVPEPDAATGRLVPILWHQDGPAGCATGAWCRVAAFRAAAEAKQAAVALHMAGADWRRDGGRGLADTAAVERLLMAKGLAPGRLGASPLRVYGWRER